MDIRITCNTPDAQLFANITANASTHRRWVKEVPAHDGHAVLVGGGPSLAEQVRLVEWRRGLGQKIFALNGAARFLNERGIFPDYQVILDARKETACLVHQAKEHLIASQCHPDLLAKLPDATLWHPAIEGISEHIPKDQETVLIGGGMSVGLSAMCLAYSLGFRKLHLFGYDSSHRKTMGHAYPQPMNDADPLCTVTMGDKSFVSSLTMARQAELFPVLCNHLIDRGCIITVDGDGLIMEVIRMMRSTEADKYRLMWAQEDYRKFSPGEHAAEDFVLLASPKADDTVIDFGCGTGRGGKRIKALTGADVRLVDFADNCLDAGNALPFICADLAQPMTIRAEFGFCTDVMEHIPPEQVASVIKNIMACVDECYFRISLTPDNMGSLIGLSLHLSVHPASWWAEQFKDYKIICSADDGENAVFYIGHKWS